MLTAAATILLVGMMVGSVLVHARLRFGPSRHGDDDESDGRAS